MRRFNKQTKGLFLGFSVLLLSIGVLSVHTTTVYSNDDNCGILYSPSCKTEGGKEEESVHTTTVYGNDGNCVDVPYYPYKKCEEPSSQSTGQPIVADTTPEVCTPSDLHLTSGDFLNFTKGQEGAISGVIAAENFSDFSKVFGFFAFLIQFLLWFSFIIVVTMLAYYGFLYVQAGLTGNVPSIQKARENLINIGISVAAILCAALIFQVVNPSVLGNSKLEEHLNELIEIRKAQCERAQSSDATTGAPVYADLDAVRKATEIYKARPCLSLEQFHEDFEKEYEPPSEAAVEQYWNLYNRAPTDELGLCDLSAKPWE